ncbi:MAG: ABC transporter ATP-binding protein [Candidatus Rokuibacteriota bacterium]
MLEIDNLQVAYGESLIVQGASLRVGAGQIVAVLGRNGVGKTTLLRGIIGLTPPRAGRVILNSEDITALSTHAIARRGVRLVPQGRRLFPSLDVHEHLVVGAHRGRPHGWDVPRVLALFPALAGRLHQRGTTLSGGEQGMLACGRALIGNPDILLMDEPSEGLAPLLVRELGRVLGELKGEGASILLVEQNLAFALRTADYVYLLSKGRTVHECTPDALRADPAVKARYLGV